MRGVDAPTQTYRPSRDRHSARSALRRRLRDRQPRRTVLLDTVGITVALIHQPSRAVTATPRTRTR